jgi:hypothetical protein
VERRLAGPRARRSPFLRKPNDRVCVHVDEPCSSPRERTQSPAAPGPPRTLRGAAASVAPDREAPDPSGLSRDEHVAVGARRRTRGFSTPVTYLSTVNPSGTRGHPVGRVGRNSHRVGAVYGGGRSARVILCRAPGIALR